MLSSTTSQADSTPPGTTRLLTSVCGAAEMLAVSVRAVERLLADGRLRSLKVGRLRRIRISDVEAYVERLAEDDDQ